MFARRLLLVAAALVTLAAHPLAAENETPAAPDDQSLGGGWQLFLPAGFEQRVVLKPEGKDRYRLGPNQFTLAGLYEQRKDKLVQIEAADPAHKGFEFKLTSGNLLTLTAEPNTTGATYLGGILFRHCDRVGKPGSKERER